MTAHHYARHDSQPAPGHYSMWWPNDGEDWRTATCLDDIDRCYAALDGYETYAAGVFLHALGVVSEEGQRIGLPDDLGIFAARGPENQEVLFSLSAEKGLRLHLHESTDPAIRDLYWKHLAGFCEMFRGMLAEAPKDPPQEIGQPADWWRYVRASFEQVEASSGPIQRIGTIPIAEPTAEAPS